MRRPRQKQCEWGQCRHPALHSRNGEQERFCKVHRRLKIKEMRDAGYFEKVPHLPWLDNESDVDDFDHPVQNTVEDIVDASDS